MSEETRENRETDLLQASFMGDIREDIAFLGLSLKDFIWIIGTAIVVGGLPFLLPIAIWFKIIWFVAVALASFLGRLAKWPYWRQRMIRYGKSKKEGDAASFVELLGSEEDGWLYKSGNTWQIVYRVKAPPWQTATYGKKRLRLAGFESFLRTTVSEGFTADLHAEQIPDYRYDIWDAKASRPASSEGIARIRENRMAQWQQLVKKDKAMRSEYILRLTIDEYKLTIRQRDDEPPELSKEEIRRFRILADIRERRDRIIGHLEQSGHQFTLLSGYELTEIIARYLDARAWRSWMEQRSDWSEEEELSLLPAEIPGDQTEEEEQEEVRETKKPLQRLFEWLKGLFVRRKKAAAIEEKTVTVEPVAELLLENSEEQQEDAISDQTEILPAPVIVIPAELRRSKKRQGLAILNRLKAAWSSRKRPKPLVETASDQENLIETVQEAAAAAESIEELPLPPVVCLTSPAASGQTFLAANMAVAYAAEDSPVYLVDLSPDRGVLTVINPLPAEGCFGGALWSSRNVPGLAVWTMDQERPPEETEILTALNEFKKKGTVIVDLPWSYPNREQLLEQGVAVAVVDSDYHHWLQWEPHAKDWPGEVWLNQDDPKVSLAKLIQEHMEAPITRTLPVFPEARQRLYQGRPIALEQDIKTIFKGGKKPYANRNEKAG
ncbi:hypothetical protein PghCCS26_46380 [Paenibacillus glycanilyticus]|uniref:Uncharacterized protein n=1 Tax=Paenibacillus glycanilyticus TaxID=126569 RepID=A0ABQ6NRR3_9BACL|nr:hypothetical protein [Paenibacillus glycanilyticus]GMK47508.1 hypothetical protein PghCCS26_46380 [Paenibacillus glycanilyticus]